MAKKKKVLHKESFYANHLAGIRIFQQLYLSSRQIKILKTNTVLKFNNIAVNFNSFASNRIKLLYLNVPFL